MKAPKMEDKEARYLNEEELAQVVKLLVNEPLKWRTATILALYTGFRRGELMGLEWKDIDYTNMTLNVKRTSQYIAGRGLVTKSPKNKTSVRFIDIDESLMAILKEYRKWWSEERLKMGDQWQDEITIMDAKGRVSKCKNDRLFFQQDSTPMHPDSLTSWVGSFSDCQGIPHFTPHNLRHTTVSLLFANQVDIRTVSAIVGHAKTSTTLNIYAHVMDSRKQDAAQKIGAVLSSIDKKDRNHSQDDAGVSG